MSKGINCALTLYRGLIAAGRDQTVDFTLETLTTAVTPTPVTVPTT
ncbi:MAG: hypothetical protein IJS22_04335 [Lachnospiraceae bacterium]|nr:hypothetical protein [Lachnospiraceae bacterium]